MRKNDIAYRRHASSIRVAIACLCLLAAAAPCLAETAYYEEAEAFIEADENIFFYDAWHAQWTAALTELDLDYYEVVDNRYQRSQNTVPTLLVTSGESARILLVVPKTPNPLLLSIFARSVDAMYEGTLPNVAILALGAPGDTISQVQLVEKALIEEEASTVLWLDENLQHGTLKGSGTHTPPPAHLARAFLDHSRGRFEGSLPNVQLLGIVDALISRPSEFELRLEDLRAPMLLLESTEETGSPAAWLEDFTALLSSLAESTALVSPPPRSEWQYQYLVIPVLGGFIIQEHILFFISFLVFMLTFAYGIFYRQTLTRHFKRIIRHWHVIILLMLLLVAGFFVGFVGALFLARFVGVSSYAPLLIMKFTLALFFASSLYRHSTGLKVFHAANRYLSAFAIFMFILNVAIGIFLNLPMTFHFTVAFLFTFFFSLMRTVWAKMCWFLAALLVFIPEFFTSGSLPSLVEFLLFRPVASTIFLTFVTLPFWSMIVRMDHLVPKKRRYFAKVLTWVMAVLFFLFSILASTSDFSPTVELRITEHVDAHSHYLALESMTPLGELRFTFGDEEYHVDSNYRRKTVELPPAEISGLATVNAAYTETLVTLDMSFDFAHPVEEFSATLTPKEDSVVLHYSDLAASVPYGTETPQVQLFASYPSKQLQTSTSIESSSPVNVLIQLSYATLSEHISFDNRQIRLITQRKETLHTGYH